MPCPPKRPHRHHRPSLPFPQSSFSPSPDVILCGWLGSKHQLTKILLSTRRRWLPPPSIASSLSHCFHYTVTIVLYLCDSIPQAFSRRKIDVASSTCAAMFFFFFTMCTERGGRHCYCWLKNWKVSRQGVEPSPPDLQSSASVNHGHELPSTMIVILEGCGQISPGMNGSSFLHRERDFVVIVSWCFEPN